MGGRWKAALVVVEDETVRAAAAGVAIGFILSSVKASAYARILDDSVCPF